MIQTVGSRRVVRRGSSDQTFETSVLLTIGIYIHVQRKKELTFDVSRVEMWDWNQQWGCLGVMAPGHGDKSYLSLILAAFVKS